MRIKSLIITVWLSVSLIGCRDAMQRDWDDALTKNTISTYEDFLRRYPNGNFSENARARLEQLYQPVDWDKANSSNAISGYEAFLKKHTNGTYADQARSKLSDMYLQRSKLWEKANTADAVAAYEGFIKIYPDGELSDKARSRIINLNLEADWKKAKSVNTIPAYETFTQKHPTGEYNLKAESEIERLLKLHRPRIEEAYSRIIRTAQLGINFDTFKGEERASAVAELLFLLARIRSDLEYFEANASLSDARRGTVAGMREIINKASSAK